MIVKPIIVTLLGILTLTLPARLPAGQAAEASLPEMQEAASLAGPCPLEIDLSVPMSVEMGYGQRLPVADRRAWAAEKTLENLKRDPLGNQEAEDLFIRSTLARARRHGFDLEKDPALSLLSLQAEAGEGSEFGDPPLSMGGVGYGVYYGNEAFLWSRRTALVANLVVPTTPGGDVETWFYNTATNRSNLGVEAFILYYAQKEARFKIFDWARAEGDHWALTLQYEDLADYLANAESGDGVARQELQLVNLTARLKWPPKGWVNRVYLSNRRTGTYDLIYQYAYTLEDPTENTFEPGEYFGSWGPIMETFQNHDGSNKPVGINLGGLAQDGGLPMFMDERTEMGTEEIYGDRSIVNPWSVNWSFLPPWIIRELVLFDESNTWMRSDDEDFEPPIYLIPNWAWAVGSTDGELPRSIVEAEDVTHYLGVESGDGWEARPEDGPGLMAWGEGDPFGAPATGKSYVFQIDAMVENIPPEGDSLPVASYGLYDPNSGTFPVGEVIYLEDFVKAQRYQPFRAEFTATGTEVLQPFILYWGYVPFNVDRFSIALE